MQSSGARSLDQYSSAVHTLTTGTHDEWFEAKQEEHLFRAYFEHVHHAESKKAFPWCSQRPMPKRPSRAWIAPWVFLEEHPPTKHCGFYAAFANKHKRKTKLGSSQTCNISGIRLPYKEQEEADRPKSTNSCHFLNLHPVYHNTGAGRKCVEWEKKTIYNCAGTYIQQD